MTAKYDALQGDHPPRYHLDLELQHAEPGERRGDRSEVELVPPGETSRVN